MASDAKWYCVDKDGEATLCVDKHDAEVSARLGNRAFPGYAPHRAVQLVDAQEIDVLKARIAELEAELEAVGAGGVQPMRRSAPAPVEPVITGAIYDFAGFLTTRDAVIEVGSTANAAPIADLIEEWCQLRDISFSDAMVKDWQNSVTTPPAQTPPPLELKSGERYAGPVLDADGNVKHRLVLLPNRPEAYLNWQAAMDWAASVGGQLPDRQEQALLYANCKPNLGPGGWHWSCQGYKNLSWHCNFDDGYQTLYNKTFEGSAVAVRRVYLQEGGAA
jgi:hypothetical protein